MLSIFIPPFLSIFFDKPCLHFPLLHFLIISNLMLKVSSLWVLEIPLGTAFSVWREKSWAWALISEVMLYLWTRGESQNSMCEVPRKGRCQKLN